MTGELTRSLQLGGIDPMATLAPLGGWPSDRTKSWLPDGFARAVLTPGGPGTLELRWAAGGEATARAWGRGATWLIDQADAWLGLRDSLDGFDPSLHPNVAQLWRRASGQRMVASGVVWQELLQAIVGQRVTSKDAAGGWRRMVGAWSEPAPGPHELMLPPSPEAMRAVTYIDLHRFDVERRRADAMLLAARHAVRLEEAATMNTADAVKRLTALPGLGAWTATTVANAALGDPDVVLIGDFWLPTAVTYNLTGDPTYHTDEVRMLAALEPFAGHRGRICKLLLSAGSMPPRRAPRPAYQRIAHR
ncbi:MAG: DNA-3-methyladenine glycosylase 2 family protein [Actinomycetota bacterium]|jgi:3-methyladenine DNA glycosylase/8-oxoguanine DNA glycosylase